MAILSGNLSHAQYATAWHGWSVGIGTTDACNLNCPHCYSRSEKTSSLQLADIKKIVETFDLSSVNLGTGENGLNKDFIPIIDYLHEQKVKMSLTSNGYTVQLLDAARLLYFNDIDISIDFPKENGHDLFRGRGSWRLAVAALEKCLECGIETSIAVCMTNHNYKYLCDFFPLVARYGINLRINVYKPVLHNRYNLSYQQFWGAIKELFRSGRIISCSEGVINAAANLTSDTDGCTCGVRSLRIRPDGEVLPCVYWRPMGLNIRDLDRDSLELLNTRLEQTGITIIPQRCIDVACPHLEECRGGCPARRFLAGRLDQPDMYCPVLRGDMVDLKPVLADRKDLVHSGYLCTLIMSA